MHNPKCVSISNPRVRASGCAHVACVLGQKDSLALTLYAHRHCLSPSVSMGQFCKENRRNLELRVCSHTQSGPASASSQNQVTQNSELSMTLCCPRLKSIQDHAHPPANPAAPCPLPTFPSEWKGHSAQVRDLGPDPARSCWANAPQPHPTPSPPDLATLFAGTPDFLGCPQLAVTPLASPLVCADVE